MPKSKTFKKESPIKCTHTQLLQAKHNENVSQNSLLHPNIRCDDDLKDILSQSSIELCSQILPTLHKDDPGIIVQIINKSHLHAALALPGTPIAQGANETASEDAFRAWIIAQALAAPGVGPNHQCPPNSVSLAFHHLTEREANSIAYSQWHIVPWVYNIQQQVPALEMPLVLWMTGSGRRGRAEMFKAAPVFE
jgi:hypothetical protein